MFRIAAVRPFFAWYDFWIGAYYSYETNTLYICVLPTVGIKIAFHGHGLG